MKQTITKYELALLDGMAVAAGGLVDAQWALVELMLRLLLVECWDEAKRAEILGHGPEAARAVVEMLRRIGVA